MTTYNRPELVIRAINSVVMERNSDTNIEIIVVDDASTTTLPNIQVEGVIYHRMPINGGPGPARMHGIQLANAPWVLILDDDDTLLPGSANYLKQQLPSVEDSAYPVYQFATHKENQREAFRLITLADYMNKSIIGDFTPVFDRQKFLQTGMQYPDNRAGGEHLLWWKIAEKFGIPSYDHPLVCVSDDASIRLTHFSSQMKKAAYHLQLAEMTLEEFGEQLQLKYPEEFRRINLARVTYSLLDNQSTLARSYLQDAQIDAPLHLALWAISWLPQSLIQKLFLLYRQHQG
ncbi:hypothetical protein C9426_17960 [Serratia sp. S1B]|nr:hypothetical protein C9426_17960 [Serratia sp. S1B]